MDKLFAQQQALLNKRLIKQAIVAFRLGSEQNANNEQEPQWLAELKCGHLQPVRHHPPFIHRPWVMTEEGRTAMLGCLLACKKCGRN